jgi:hypothetical protein
VNDEGRPERRPLTDADQRRTRLARERIRAIEQHRRNARMAEEAMPLVRYYSCWGGPLLAVPIGEYYVRGRWAP